MNTYYIINKPTWKIKRVKQDHRPDKGPDTIVCDDLTQAKAKLGQIIQANINSLQSQIDVAAEIKEVLEKLTTQDFDGHLIVER